MKKSYLLLIFLAVGYIVNAQEFKTEQIETVEIGKSIFPIKNKRNFSRKGNFYGHWGYNNSWYSKSDIHFKGTGYEFTLKDVVAHDRQSPYKLKYLSPENISIPQWNLRLGYFIKDNYSISIGWDHMKYVMDIPQKVYITGYIENEVSTPGIPTGKYEGVYDNDLIEIGSDMLTFEHTDGYNYANVEVERYDDIWVSKSQVRTLTLETGLGAGLIIPRTDARFFGVGQNNALNVAGYGASVKAGLKFYMNRGLFLQYTSKLGTSNLTDIHTTGRNKFDKASQKISYIENFLAIGYQF